MHEILFTFQNTHHALKMEKYLKSLNYQVKLIPTPFEIFSECGFSLLVNMSEEDLQKINKAENVNPVESYVIIKEGENENTTYIRLASWKKTE